MNDVPNTDKTFADSKLDVIKTKIQGAISRFDERLPRDAHRSVTLVAVSKTFGVDEISPFLESGQRIFGENRVQEAKEKWPELRGQFEGIQLHLIGPLQTNKAKEAVALFDVIQSVDREKVAAHLSREMVAQDRNLPCYVQVNIGAEPQKAGVSVQETVEFVARCRNIHGLSIVGLMCIPPADLPPGPFFAQLAGLANSAGVENLSMGMSADFETAIAMGATHVRVGSALFGSR